MGIMYCTLELGTWYCKCDVMYHSHWGYKIRYILIYKSKLDIRARYTRISSGKICYLIVIWCLSPFSIKMGQPGLRLCARRRKCARFSVSSRHAAPAFERRRSRAGDEAGRRRAFKMLRRLVLMSHVTMHSICTIELLIKYVLDNEVIVYLYLR